MSHDPRDTFRADQEAAQTEQETREQTTWRISMEQEQAKANAIAGEAIKSMRLAEVWEALGRLIQNLAWAVVLYVVLTGVAAIIDAIQGR